MRDLRVADARVVERLYDTFAGYQLPIHIDYCTYCDTADYEQSLHGDLRSLPAELVDKYVWDAIHHTGNEEDFKHFLPRVYELLAQGALPFADAEMTLGRLGQAGWADWVEVEREVVIALLDSIWDDAMRLPDPPVDIDSLGCGLGLAFAGLPPQRVHWREDDRPLARRRLVEFVLANAEELRKRRLRSAWWSEYEEVVESVVGWVTAPETSEHLTESLKVDPDHAEATSRAIELLGAAASEPD